MMDPTQFDEMINWAFAIATGIYGLLGVAGYIMFGNSVSDEVGWFSTRSFVKQMLSDWSLRVVQR